MAQSLRPIGLTHQDNERCCRALLSGIAESRLDDVGCGQVVVSVLCDDDGVLATSLGQHWQVMTPRPEQLGRFPSSREDDPIDLGVAHQVFTSLIFLNIDELQNVPRDPSLPQAFRDDGSTVAGLWSGLE